MPRGEQGEKPRRQWAPDARALSVVGDRWVMVIVRDLASGPLRLEALRRWLPGVSAGALEARLSRMADAGLITRRRRRSLPPRVDLELTEQGHALGEAIGELARWELRTQWSRPREDEWVDVGACFRLAPLLSPAPTASAANGQPRAHDRRRQRQRPRALHVRPRARPRPHRAPRHAQTRRPHERHRRPPGSRRSAPKAHPPTSRSPATPTSPPSSSTSSRSREATARRRPRSAPSEPAFSGERDRRVWEGRRERGLHSQPSDRGRAHGGEPPTRKGRRPARPPHAGRRGP